MECCLKWFIDWELLWVFVLLMKVRLLSVWVELWPPWVKSYWNCLLWMLVIIGMDIVWGKMRQECDNESVCEYLVDIEYEGDKDTCDLFNCLVSVKIIFFISSLSCFCNRWIWVILISMVEEKMFRCSYIFRLYFSLCRLSDYIFWERRECILYRYLFHSSVELLMFITSCWMLLISVCILFFISCISCLWRLSDDLRSVMVSIFLECVSIYLQSVSLFLCHTLRVEQLGFDYQSLS